VQLPREAAEGCAVKDTITAIRQTCHCGHDICSHFEKKHDCLCGGCTCRAYVNENDPKPPPPLRPPPAPWRTKYW
jgi:hypothetical protein